MVARLEVVGAVKGPGWSIPKAATDKIPDDMMKPNKTGEGFRWQRLTPNDRDAGDGVRIDRGDPTHQNPSVWIM